MKLTRPTDDELGEYVDGRLGEQRRAEIAAWLRDNPRRAAEIERLRALNEALRGIGSEVLSEPVPDRLREVLRRERQPEETGVRPTKRSRSGFLDVAAAFVIFGLGCAGGWSAHAMLQERVSELDRLLANASYAFGFYTDHQGPAVEFPADEQAAFAAVASRIFERELPLPDLQAAGYHYVGARVLPTGASVSALLFFEGDRERDDLSVFLWPAGQMPESARETRLLGDVASRHWVDKDLAFAVMAAKDNAHLDQVADQVIEFYKRPPQGPGVESEDVTDDKT